MITKKINLLSKNLTLTVTEPDWRKMFEVYLNLDMLKEFVREDEIVANRKAAQKKLTLAREQPKKYHMIHDKPAQSQFYYFIRGLYFEYGIGLTRPDPIKAYEIFLQGFEENQDSLCAYKIAATQSNPKNKCTVKVDKQKAMFFLVMAAILIDLQYQGNLCDIRTDMIRLIDTYEEGVKLSDILIQKFGGAYYNNDMKKIYSLMFDYQYCHPSHSQDKYNTLLQQLEIQLKTSGDQFCLIYLFQLLIQNNLVQNKNIKQIIDIGINSKKEAFRAAFSILFKEFTTLSKGIRDHILFYNGRQLFYEMYNFIKFFGGPDKSELFNQMFTINELLFEKQFLILRQSLHYSLTMRIRSEMYEKGLGVGINLQLALDSINKELSMPKENENYYAYANYVAAKLKRKLNSQYTEQQASEHFQKCFNQFSSRLNSEQNESNITRLVYLYYLARISKLWKQNFLDTQNKYKEALNLYLRERHVYKNAKTFQYEILCIKIEKKTNSQGQASLYYGHGILSPQHQQSQGGAGPNQQIFNYNNSSIGAPANLYQSSQQNPQQMNTNRMNGQEAMHQSNMNGLSNSANINNQQNQMHNSQLNNNQMNASYQIQGSQQANNNNMLAGGNSRILQNQQSNQMQQSIGMQPANQQASQQHQQGSLYNQNSSGLNGMANSNMKMSNPHQSYNDNQIQNSTRIANQQNSNIMAQQLIGNNTYQNNPTQPDRQNYFDTSQNHTEMLYSANRANNYNKSVSPNPNSNINKSNYQPQQMNSMVTGQNQYTTPGGIDIVGLNSNNRNMDNRSYQNNLNTSPNNRIFNSNNNINNYGNPPNSTQSMGNNAINFNQIRSGSSNTLNDQQSPYQKAQNQSIFGNNVQSKYLSFGFQSHVIDRGMQEKLTLLKQRRTFYDPKDVIIMDFLHRGNNYITSEAVIVNRNKQNTLQNSPTKNQNIEVNMVSADKLSKFRSYKKHMNVSSDDQQILDGEPVVVKQFIVSDPRVIDDMFMYIENQEKKLINQSSQINNQSTSVNSQAYQQHLAQVFLTQHLVYIKGFSYQPISNDAIALYLFYPAQSYNLYGAMKKNVFSLLEKLLIASQICDSIQNLHASSIFHLNLKPSNILFDNKKQPYLSGWEIKRKENTSHAEENIDEEEQDEKFQINYGYTAPEVLNSLSTIKNQGLNNSNNRSVTPPRNIPQVNNYSGLNSPQPQFGPLNTHQGISQFGPRSDIWSLGMILHYLFFRIDSGEGNFCRDKRVYGGFNLIITEYAIGSNYFLDKIKETIEEMVKSSPEQRTTLANVKDVFQRLYIELDGQIKSDHSPNRSFNSTMITQHTGANSNFNSVNNAYSNYNNNNYMNNQSNSLYSNNNNMNSTPQLQLQVGNSKQQSVNNRSYYSPNKYDSSQQYNNNSYNNDPYYSNSSQNQYKNHGDPLGVNGYSNNNNNYHDSYNNYNSSSQMKNQQQQQSTFFNNSNNNYNNNISSNQGQQNRNYNTPFYS